MREPYVIWPGLLDDASCDDILKKGLLIPKVSAGVGSDGRIDLEVRSAEVRTISYDTQVVDGNEVTNFEPLFKMVERKMREANRNNFGFDIQYLGYTQLTSYYAERTGHYAFHHDVFWGHVPYQRKLSAVLQLSDPESYSGGDFEFERYEVPSPPDQKVMRQRGSLVVFPSPLYHRVIPVTKGIRHSCTFWMEGPAWK